jgi:hypothetical protein
MTTPRTILRDCALALPPLVGIGAWLWGPWGAFGVAASGVVSLLNLALLAWLVDRVVKVMTAGGGAGALVVVLAKPLVALGGYALLLSWFDPHAVALGLGAVILGLGAQTVIEALRIPSPEEA